MVVVVPKHESPGCGGPAERYSVNWFGFAVSVAVPHSTVPLPVLLVLAFSTARNILYSEYV